MNYALIYADLIKHRRMNVIETGEVHHILPKCLGGDNSTANLIRLTYREHYIAHRLLTKIYPKNHNLKYAVYMMSLIQSSKSRHPTSKQISISRQNLSEAAKIRSLWFNPGKTENSRKAARLRMIENNPITKEPWKNHTAHPVIVTYTNGTTQRFECASLIPIPYATVKWMRRHGKGSKKHSIISIKKERKDET
jgi:hypothetical protein